MVELKDQIEGFQDTLVPPILNKDKVIKYFFIWRTKSITIVSDMVRKIAENMDMTLFQGCMSNLVNLGICYENFEKEVTHDKFKYIPYRQVVD
jgi:hypothetical protein